MKKNYTWYRRDLQVIKGKYSADKITESNGLILLYDNNAVLAVIKLGDGEFIKAE